MSATLFAGLMAKPSPMAFMIWCITVALSMWASIMTRLNLRSKPFGVGGNTLAKPSIQKSVNCSSPPMGVVPMGSEIVYGRRSCKTLPMKSRSRLRWRIIPRLPCRWNKIEHRLFSFISINWRAKPLTSLEVVLELISHTTTNEGLTVMAVKDSQTYPTGLKVTDEELAALHLCRNPFHAEWNYTIKPQH